MTASYGTVFWPVIFILGQPSDGKKGGYVIQHVVGKETGIAEQNYWEAFRVMKGETSPPLTTLDWRKGIAEYKIQGDLDRKLKFAYEDHIVKKYLEAKANDWFWSNKHLNNPSVPQSKTIILSWEAKVFYVDGVSELPEYFKVGKVPGAGKLPSALDAGNHDKIVEWLAANKAIKPIRHELEVKVSGGKNAGKTVVVSHEP
jgi:hypothetical protein